VKRPLKPEELHIWRLVAGTVHPLPGRHLPAPTGEGGERGDAGGELRAVHRAQHAALPVRPAPRAVPFQHGEGKDIEPNRRHRIAHRREEIGGRIDLHGMTQDQALAALRRFLERAWDEGYRAVLVITGKGVQGDGVLRRRAPEWLGAPELSHIVAGVSEAHRRHGGEGALYVALKRKPRNPSITA
jgi:DNA-nicking Smr family endonuclease